MRPHRQRRGRLPGRQQRPQRRLDLGLPLLGRQVQQPHVLPVRPPRLSGDQRVVGPSVRQRGIQVLPVDVAREGPGLAHQPGADVPVVDAVVGLAAQPFHLLHPFAGVPHLDRLSRDPCLDDLADEPRRHRVGVLLHLDGAAPAHLDPLPFQGLQPPRRQRPQAGHFLGHRRGPRRVAPRHQRPYELPVRLPAGEVPAAAQQQGLLHGFLEAPVGLLAVPVLMGAGRVGRLGHDPVVPQQGLVLGRVLLRVAIVMHGHGHAIGAVALARSAQLPEGVLQPFAQAGETLREAQGHVLPVGGGQHEVVDQVREGLPLEGHAQLVHVAEVGGAQAARLVGLGEEHLLGRPVLGLPLPHAPLQGAARPLPVALGILLLQPPQQGLGLQGRLALQQFFQARPDVGERVGPGPPGPGGAGLAGELVQVAVLACGLAVHACLHRRLGQRCSLTQSFAEFLHLGVRRLSAGPHRQLLYEGSCRCCTARRPARCSNLQRGRLVVGRGEG